MEVGEILEVSDQGQWRQWLEKNNKSAKEIWLVYYKKHSGKPRIPYNDAVEEALCFGWIDSTTKPFDTDRSLQRFTPRRKNSQLSEMNKERIRRLIKDGKMTQAGLDSISNHLEQGPKSREESRQLIEFKFPGDIIQKLKADPVVWEHYNQFPESYKKIRVAWIDGARKRPEVFDQRLRYFIRMTAKNKKFGMVQ